MMEEIFTPIISEEETPDVEVEDDEEKTEETPEEGAETAEETLTE